MCDGKRQTQASVFIDGAAPVLAAHPTDWSKPESITGFILPRADVESRKKDGVVVVSAVSASQSGLPVTEAIQCVVCMVVDHQAILLFIQKYEAHNDNVDISSYCTIFKQTGNHVQDGEDICGDVLVAVVVHHLSVHHHQSLHVDLLTDLILHQHRSFVPGDKPVLIREDENVLLWRFGHVFLPSPTEVLPLLLPVFVVVVMKVMTVVEWASPMARCMVPITTVVIDVVLIADAARSVGGAVCPSGALSMRFVMRRISGSLLKRSGLMGVSSALVEDVRLVIERSSEVLPLSEAS